MKGKTLLGQNKLGVSVTGLVAVQREQCVAKIRSSVSCADPVAKITGYG